jgi:[pyruvate, water dikinase]-phosphate phosphotransferase / [pyruvate, water dikinase] kinase
MTRDRRPTRIRSSPKNRVESDSQAWRFHVISDATGGLPRHFLGAILTQFPMLKEHPVYYPFSDTKQRIEAILEKIPRSKSLVFSSLADPQLKEILVRRCSKLGLPHYDLTGGAVGFISTATGLSPENDVTLVHPCDEKYFQRIDAWEFTLQHDDGRRLDSIHLADIVLVGLSRVSKTPTSAYLGWLGYKVANVSFAPETGLPAELKKCKGRVVALTMKPKLLAQIRQRRFEINGFAEAISKEQLPASEYVDPRKTLQEVMLAEQLYRKHRLPIVDVSECTIEETAAHVLATLKKNGLA